MSRKRTSPTEDDDPEDAEDNMEVEVDSASEAEDEDEEENDERRGAAAGDEMPFLDTFYGLAASSPAERAQSAQIMIQHCLIGPNANSKDAAYAFRRLLNGLCSGRAAARQGYASALTSFLKIGHQSGALKEMQNNAEGTVLTFVRNQLVNATDPSKSDGGYGKKKGSEERDHHFGRLFGILSVIRSGLLLPEDDQFNLEDLKEVASGFATDLIELYDHRKWMREPTAFAIITMLDSYYELCPQSEAVEVVNHLISEVVVPGVLSCEVADYSAEQIAIALNIQSQVHERDMTIPTKLNTPVLSKENVPLLAKALSATSIVASPRAHVVWDVIWCPYLAMPKERKGKLVRGEPQTLALREKVPVCGDSASEIIVSIVEHVIVELLLGVEGGQKATHERRALAMSLIKVLCGSPTMSNKIGPCRLSLQTDLLESDILIPVVVQKLFIDVICAGGGKQSGHLLKPMALSVLESITSGDELSYAETRRRLSCAKGLLVGDPRFDGRTKSGTCANLLRLDGQEIKEITHDLVTSWQEYVAFLLERILDTAKARADDETAPSYEAIGYIDLLFNAAKRFTRLSHNAKYDDFKVKANQEILAFFFVGAFFDCSAFSNESGTEAACQAASSIQEALPGAFPYSLRIVLSARFYSLLADFALVATPSKVQIQELPGNKNKDAHLFEILSQCNQGWAKIETLGCKKVGETVGASADADMLDDETIAGIVKKQQEAATAGLNSESNALQKFRIGCASVSTALQFHLLRCGNSESPDMEDDLDNEDSDDDEADIKEFISDLASAQHNLIKVGAADKKDNKNPLLGFGEVCAGILSSQFGGSSQSLGASPKLLRESVKIAWSSAMLLCAERKIEPSLLDESVLNLLLSSIGAAEETNDDDTDDEDEEESGDDDDNDAVFTDAAAAGLGVSDDEEEQPQDGEVEEKGNDDIDEGGEVELDPSQLQSFLLESDDDESMVLEHHAGADKALAKLIRIKQEARKAGQQAREREEMSDQLRCTLLLETVLSNPGRQFDSLFTSKFLQGLFLPLLSTRRKLEKSLISGTKLGKKSATGDSEKRALTDKLASLLKIRLCKLKALPVVAGPQLPVLLGEIMDEVRKAVTDEQISCCSSAMIAVCKMASSVNELDSMRPSYVKLVDEWATKRTTRLKTSIFADLVQQQKSTAQVLLSSSLCQAARNARSPFLKSEAFRLLSTLAGTNAKESPDEPSDTEKKGHDTFYGCCDSFVTSVIEALKDSEMKKAKRVRDILKTTEKLIDFLNKKPLNDSGILSSLAQLKEEIAALKIASESQGVVLLCGSLSIKIETFVKDANEAPQTSSSKASTNSKSKKGKKKGKKR